jgi:hypothetical protein
VEVLVDQNNIKALRGPFPNAALIPTSAVNVLNVCEDSPLAPLQLEAKANGQRFRTAGRSQERSRNRQSRAPSLVRFAFHRAVPYSPIDTVPDIVPSLEMPANEYSIDVPSIGCTLATCNLAA